MHWKELGVAQRTELKEEPELGAWDVQKSERPPPAPLPPWSRPLGLPFAQMLPVSASLVPVCRC